MLTSGTAWKSGYGRISLTARMRNSLLDEKELAKLVQALLNELDNPERQLSSIVLDFDECGIDYCIIGSLAVRIHNYVRFGDDIYNVPRKLDRGLRWKSLPW